MGALDVHHAEFRKILENASITEAEIFNLVDQYIESCSKK
jgi:hypothetical protein